MADATSTPPPVTGTDCPFRRFMPHAILAGAFLLFVAFFLPWWGLTGVPEDRPGFGNGVQVKTPDLLTKNAEWYARYAVWDRFQKQRDAMLNAAREGEDVNVGRVSISLFGRNTGTGVVAFIYSFLAVAIVIGPVFVPVLRPGTWAGYLASAVICAGIFLSTLIEWVFCSPGQDVEGQLSQGISIGVWFALIGSAVVVAAGTMAGLKGLRGFLAGMQK